MSHLAFHRARAMVALFLTIALSCISVFLFSSAMIYKHFDARSLKTDNDTVYLSIQHESDPTKLPNTPETLHDFLALYRDLSQSDAYTYYELYAQPILWGMNLRTLSVVSALVGLLAILASLILLARIARTASRKLLSFAAVLVIHIMAFAASIGVYQSVLADRLTIDLFSLIPYSLLFFGVDCLIFLLLLCRRKTHDER